MTSIDFSSDVFVVRSIIGYLDVDKCQCSTAKIGPYNEYRNRRIMEHRSAEEQNFTGQELISSISSI